MDNEIKRIRTTLGLTRHQFAKALSLSNACIANYELGLREPSLKNAVKVLNFSLSKGIKTSLEKIYGLKNEEGTVAEKH